MGIEIERKFLIDLDRLGPLSDGERIRQAYIATADLTTVRVRIQGERAYLTLKGATQGLARLEFEYPIPLADAQSMMQTLCSGPAIDKTRYLKTVHAHTWEIDIFDGDNVYIIIWTCYAICNFKTAWITQIK